MANRPSLSLGTWERQKEAHGTLAKDIDEAINIFVKSLGDIADRYKWCIVFFSTSGTVLGLTQNHSSRDCMQVLTSLGINKKLTKGPTTMYGAFFAKKLKEVNKGMCFLPIIRTFDRLNILYVRQRTWAFNHPS